MSKNIKTMAMRVLEGHAIPYTPFYYDMPEHLSQSGPRGELSRTVAAAIGLSPEQTFKTLVVLPERPAARPILALLPGDSQLDLKKLAAAAGEKKVQMASHAEAERITGLEKGGISPLALLDRHFPVFVDETALLFDQIEISAGKRGTGVLAPVEPLLALLQATLADLTA